MARREGRGAEGVEDGIGESDVAAAEMDNGDGIGEETEEGTDNAVTLGAAL